MEARVEMAVTPGDVQVAAKPQRRSFTVEYKRRVLKDADACTTPRAVGALLRREGCTRRIWWSGVEPGRVGELAALTPKKRAANPFLSILGTGSSPSSSASSRT